MNLCLQEEVRTQAHACAEERLCAAKGRSQSLPSLDLGLLEHEKKISVVLTA